MNNEITKIRMLPTDSYIDMADKLNKFIEETEDTLNNLRHPRPILIIRYGMSMDTSQMERVTNSINIALPDLTKTYFVIFTSGENKETLFELLDPRDIKEEARQETLDILNDIIVKQRNSNESEENNNDR